MGANPTALNAFERTPMDEALQRDDADAVVDAINAAQVQQAAAEHLTVADGGGGSHTADDTARSGAGFTPREAEAAVEDGARDTDVQIMPPPSAET
eukprot:scaffold396_cov339-Prasinococcus_capsulatus_cf.AAC.10